MYLCIYFKYLFTYVFINPTQHNMVARTTMWHKPNRQIEGLNVTHPSDQFTIHVT